MRNFVFTLLLILFCSLSFQDDIYSIEKLLDNSKIYNGKIVTVSGYLVDEFENSSLYSSRKDKRKSNIKEALWIDSKNKDIKYFNKKGIEIKYSSLKRKVLITGIFICKPDTINGKIFGHGHMNGWPAELTDVTMIKEIN